MSNRHNEPLAVGGVFFAVLAWTSGPLAVRGIHAGAPTIVFWRMLIAQPAMIGLAYATGGRITLAMMRSAVLPGALLGGSIIASFISFQRTSIANATLIGAMLPAVILLAAPRLFGERSNPRQIALALVAFAGVVVVVIGADGGSGASRVGDAFAVANLVIWTAYFIKVKQARDADLHATSFLASMMIVGCVFVTPWALIASDDITELDAKGWALIVMLVIVAGVLGHGTMVWAQRHVEITLTSLITLLQPVLSSVGAWMIFGQRLKAVQLVGGAIVLIALAGLAAEARPTPGRPAALSAVAE